MKKLKNDGDNDNDNDNDNDRISSLPRNVKELIMKHLPIRDAARTCIWSSKWRYVWGDHPYLILDGKFWYDIKQYKLSSKPNTDFGSIVNRILLSHTGNVHQFLIDISIIHPEVHCDIDLWLSVLCRRGLKKVSIVNRANNTYTIPACVFNAPELTYLFISRCIINPMETCFIKLQTITLNSVILKSCILETPHLTSLSLVNCFGVHGFIISAPKLTSFALMANEHFNLTPYLLCSNITYACIHLSNIILDLGGIEFVNLLLLFSSWPQLKRFALHGASLKYLTTGMVMDTLSSVLKLTYFAPFNIHLDQLCWILRIIGNSPLLETFEICLSPGGTLNYSEEQSLMTMSIDQLQFVKLHKVKIRFFKGSRIELQFMKILLHCSPSLKHMLVVEDLEMSLEERLKISKELMRFQRAYPKPEIIFECSVINNTH